jgi:hypothetical protein
MVENIRHKYATAHSKAAYSRQIWGKFGQKLTKELLKTDE